MRRCLAILLLVLFGYPLLAPAFVGGPDSKLPACCRRNGTHHCSMQAADEPLGNPAWRVKATCPSYPRAITSLGGSPALQPGDGTLPVAPPGLPFRVRPAQADAYRHLLPSNQKRGPPSSPTAS